MLQLGHRAAMALSECTAHSGQNVISTNVLCINHSTRTWLGAIRAWGWDDSLYWRTGMVVQYLQGCRRAGRGGL